uniref:Uncharacterized protein n=1 Tax=Anguilla anguilla TaxID=7936 RepID=A0A0E9WA31_ANGAN
MFSGCTHCWQKLWVDLLSDFLLFFRLLSYNFISIPCTVNILV